MMYSEMITEFAIWQIPQVPSPVSQLSQCTCEASHSHRL